MATVPMNGVLHHLRRAALLQDGADLSDGQLLDRFLQSEHAAFEILLRRHGAMVLGVCRRVLNNSHDAEDAFQATFLVLVRKAASLRLRTGVGNWLYGVAYHTALKARAQAIRRRTKEAQVRNAAQQDTPKVEWRDWQPILDEELNRLSDKYREPIVLCELQGRTRREAARQLGLAEGTLSGRLTTARRTLAKRLAGRGVTLSAGALAAAVSQSTAAACVPAPLLATTSKAAALFAAGQTAAGVISIKVAALTDGVLKAMLMTKLKVMAAFVLVVGLLTAGASTLLNTSHAGNVGVPETVVAPAPTAAELPTPEESSPVPVQRPKKEQPKDGITMSGKLESIDADKVTIGIFKRGEPGLTKTIALAKDARIVRDGKEVKATDLKLGGQVTLKLSPDQKTVTALTMATPFVSGPLKAVDTVKNTITVTVGARNAKEDKTYPVLKDAEITVDGKAATLADLKTGTTLMLRVIDGTTVAVIRTAVRKDRKQDE